MSPDYNAERSYAVPPELVAGFQRDLAGVAPGSVTQFPDLTDSISHFGTYPRPDTALVTGMVVDHQTLAKAGAPQDFVVESQTFFNKPPRRLGREDSHNKVFFGLLLTHGIDVQAPVGLDVAVKTKPIDKMPALLGEVAMFQYLQSLGVATFQPYAFLQARDNVHFLTVNQQNVDPMDTIEWMGLSMPDRWQQLNYAVETLVTLHSLMLFHGDAKFKNICFGDLGEIVIADPELMVSCSGLAEAYLATRDDAVKKITFDNIKRKMNSDFAELTKSIQEHLFRGLPNEQKPRTKPEVFKELKRHLYNPYREAIYNGKSPYKRVLIDVFDIMLSEHKEQSRQ